MIANNMAIMRTTCISQLELNGVAEEARDGDAVVAERKEAARTIAERSPP